MYNLVGVPTSRQVTKGRALSNTDCSICLNHQAAASYEVRTPCSGHKSLEGLEGASRQRGLCEQTHGGAEWSVMPKLSVCVSTQTGDRGQQWVEGKRDSSTVIRGQVKTMPGQQTSPEGRGHGRVFSRDGECSQNMLQMCGPRCRVNWKNTRQTAPRETASASAKESHSQGTHSRTGISRETLTHWQFNEPQTGSVPPEKVGDLAGDVCEGVKTFNIIYSREEEPGSLEAASGP